MALRRLAWVLTAGAFLVPLASVWGTADFSTAVRVWPWLWLVLAAASPGAALGLLALTGPLAVVALAKLGPAPMGGNEMLEVQVLPVLAGVSLRWAWSGAPPPGRLGMPALVFGAVVLASALAGTAVQPSVLAAGGDWPALVWEHAWRFYFSDPRAFPAWHAAAVWIEALCLASIAERYLVANPGAGARLSTLAAAGLAAEASWSLWRLVEIAGRSTDFGAAFWHHAVSTRISPHFPDVNAIGSLFALGVTACIVWLIGRDVSGRHRFAAAAGTAVLGSGLWLSQSRAAMASAALVAALSWMAWRRPSRRLVVGAAAAAGVLAIGLAAMGISRVSRAPASTALVIRVEMAKAGARMVADHPWFGVGIGRFRDASPAYIPASLHAVFPVVAAGGENAHNQFVQVAGELGIAGLLACVWFWWAVLGPAVRVGRAARAASWITAWTAGLVALLVSAMMGHPFLTPYVTLLTLLIVGVLAGQLPAVAPPLHRRWRWIALAACLVLAATLPFRIVQARRSVDLDNHVFGATAVAGDLDGVRYRRAELRSSWFVRSTARTVEMPMRSTSTAGCTVTVTIDRLPADIVQVTADRWHPVVFKFREPDTRRASRRIDLEAAPADCGLLVGRLRVTD